VGFLFGHLRLPDLSLPWLTLIPTFWLLRIVTFRWWFRVFFVFLIGLGRVYHAPSIEYVINQNIYDGWKCSITHTSWNESSKDSFTNGVVSQTGGCLEDIERDTTLRGYSDINEDKCLKLRRQLWEWGQETESGTFCTWELTRFMVLSQDQEKGREFSRERVELSWSLGSS